MPARILTPELGDGRIALPDVTLLAVTGIARPATARALALSQRGLRFAHALFLSDRPPPPGTPARWCRTASISSRMAYSRFMLRDLADHISTTHVLCVQWDGYVVNPTAWDPAFLGYDYIGAPWPHFSDGRTVGNGGFSLRSRRLVEACAALPLLNEAEDVSICRTYRAVLEAQGLTFAPEPVARRFAYERSIPNGDEFGFHGAFNLIHLIPARDMALLFAGLEPNLLTRREHLEILQAALRRGHLRLASTMARRLRYHYGKRR